MRATGNPFRILISLLLVVAIPFCCCSFHALLAAHATCGPHAEAGSFVAVAHHHTEPSTPDHDADHPSDPASGGGNDPHHHSSVPCGPDHDNQNNCSCGKHDAKMLPGTTPIAVPPGPVLAATLPWTLINDRVPSARIAIVRHDALPIAKPPTSLLRLHCALVV